MLKQAQSLPDAPDDLLRFCDSELQRLRAQRKSGNKHRAAVLAASIFVLVLGTMSAFLFLFAKLQEIPREGHTASGAPRGGDSLEYHVHRP